MLREVMWRMLLISSYFSCDPCEDAAFACFWNWLAVMPRRSIFAVLVRWLGISWAVATDSVWSRQQCMIYFRWLMLGPCHNLHSLSSQLANFLDHGRICWLKSWMPFRILFWFLVSCVVVLVSLGMCVLDDQAMIAMVEPPIYFNQFLPSLELTVRPWKWMVGIWNTTFLLGRPIFRGYVSFREGNSKLKFPMQEFMGAIIFIPACCGICSELRCEEWKSVHFGNKRYISIVLPSRFTFSIHIFYIFKRWVQIHVMLDVWSLEGQHCPY